MPGYKSSVSNFVWKRETAMVPFLSNSWADWVKAGTGPQHLVHGDLVLLSEGAAVMVQKWDKKFRDRGAKGHWADYLQGWQINSRCRLQEIVFLTSWHFWTFSVLQGLIWSWFGWAKSTAAVGSFQGHATIWHTEGVPKNKNKSKQKPTSPLP